MNVTPEQAKEMFYRFPGIEGYLNACQLKNEYRYLCDNELILNEWQKLRLEELRSYEASSGRDFYDEAI